MNHDYDSSWITLIRSGDKEAFEKIYNRYHKSLFYFAMRYLNNKELSEDAVQDIFVKLWEIKTTLNPSKPIKNFLFLCLKNHLLNMIRNQKTKQLIIASLEKQHHTDQYHTLANLSYSDYKHIIDRALLELSCRQREVFVLKIFNELSNQEVAQKLGLSVNTVKVHYYHSSKHIKSYLQKHLESDNSVRS